MVKVLFNSVEVYILLQHCLCLAALPNNMLDLSAFGHTMSPAGQLLMLPAILLSSSLSLLLSSESPTQAHKC